MGRKRVRGMEGVEQVMMKLESSSAEERIEGMLIIEKYLEEKVRIETEKLRIQEKKNDEREAAMLIRQLLEGKDLNEIADERQLGLMHNYATEKLRQLRERRANIARLQNPVPPPAAAGGVGSDQGGGNGGDTSHGGDGAAELPPDYVADTSGGRK